MTTAVKALSEFDVLTFGETMLRLSPPGGARLSDTTTFDIWVGGSESNVAVALTALGFSATWIGRLPDNPVGRRVESALLTRRVNVDHVVWTSPEDRLGIFYAEMEQPPRQGAVYYDRAASAASGMAPGDLPDRLFETHRHLHLTGITPALSASCLATTVDAVRRAKENEMSVSFDVNYRSKLWNPEEAARALLPIVAAVDLLFCSYVDSSILFGASGEPLERARYLRSKFDISSAVVTCGARGAAACEIAGEVEFPAVPVGTSIGRFGSGDAFVGAYLARYLAGAPMESCVAYGVAAASIKRTVPGDLLTTTFEELKSIVQREQQSGWR